ncbi:30S ribosomal protein S12 methylthiotransferase RimO [Desulfonatronovibrio hydrogenovorans]|uniref:30S ribosomal protein S12 methylthiotransferase RimO n=1 Tax=Desulfonatronovibrio hydrogenovorans TaxID=53245 RepID=UPI00048D3B00|nr:30S ribosomal protein S12 methylthiotransferase RimO [Desulfonatronovibrio hydrogenovorans]
MVQKIRVFTRSLGCPKNLVDTETILGGLGQVYEPVEDISRSQVVLINTCAFIRPAVEESLDVIFSTHQEIKELEKRPLLVVTGCLPARYGPGLSLEIPEVDVFTGIKDQAELPGLILKKLGLPSEGSRSWRKVSTAPGYAYLKISEGCNNRCSFCTIPSIRGRHKSRPLDEVIAEAGHLLAMGVRELIVVAQDSTAYGRDLGYKHGLAELTKELSGLSGLDRLRLMYLYPSGLSQKLLESMARIRGPLVPYFDVPFQHSHPDILRKMGRPFREDPEIIIRRIRQIFPETAIRSTLITGYPGESEEHFQHLLSFVKKNRLQHLGVFPYHPEEGTRAAGFPGQIPDQVKAKRVKKIMLTQKKISRSLLKSFEGQYLDVLVDEPHAEWPGLYTGRTWFQAPEVDGITYVSGDDVRPGNVIRAKIQETRDYDLVALQD